MKLTTEMRYGTRAMLDLALHYGRGPLSSRAIAEHQDVSAKYLEHLLAALRNAGLIFSVRGQQGGHALARPPEEITLYEIYELFEGGRGLVECTSQPETCARSGGCVTQEVWARMYQECTKVLQSTTLADLVERARQKGGALAEMYYI